MPIGPLHKIRQKKNFAVLAMIIGWIALVWVITVLKIQSKAEESATAATPAPAAIEAPQPGE